MPRIPIPKRPSERDKGICPECGKSITLSNTTGMLCSHIHKLTGYVCTGSGKAPLKTVAMFINQKITEGPWTPERRSE